MSWKPQVRTPFNPKFYGNALAFATRAEAEANVLDLSMRWFAVTDTRVVESDQPVTHAWENGKLVSL